jgi:hypothetical protein
MLYTPISWKKGLNSCQRRTLSLGMGEWTMEKLYLDNYRGFTNQYIEIRDVNFFIGENSTGKSSVLSASNILFNQDFWNNLDYKLILLKI